MKLHRTPLFLGLVAVLLVLAAALNGYVFLRLPNGPTTLLPELGGAVLRSGDVNINGHPGRMTVYGFEKATQALAAEIAQRLDRPDILRAGARNDNLLFPWSLDNTNLAQVFVFSDPNADNAIAIALESLDKKTDPAPVWPWNDLRMPSDFQIGFSAVISDGRTALVSGSSALPVDVARTQLNESLASSGWTAVSPAAEVSSSTLYSKGKNGEVVLTTVIADPASGQTQILVLRRKPDPKQD